MRLIRLNIFVLFGCILLSGFTSSLLPEDIPEGIISAISKGSATNLAKYFNVNVELTINNNEEIYSKEQAELILKDFFSKNTPTSFDVLHKGGKEGSRYAIGNLVTSNGTFRITILVKIKDSQPYIHQLRIEKENAE